MGLQQSIYPQFWTLGSLGWLYSQADSVVKVQKDQQPLQSSVPSVYHHTEQVKARQVLRHTPTLDTLLKDSQRPSHPSPPGLDWPSLLAQAPLDHLAQRGKTSDSLLLQNLSPLLPTLSIPPTPFLHGPATVLCSSHAQLPSLTWPGVLSSQPCEYSYHTVPPPYMHCVSALPTQNPGTL